MNLPAASAADGDHELYLYWRTAQADWPAAAAALTAWQQRLSSGLPGLQARWLRRADNAEPHATLMEIYTRPGGIDAATAQRIAVEGSAAVARWRVGERHLETFIAG